MTIKKFTILGERCSGTNFLEEALTKNFNLEVTWDYGWKHFFGFDSYENSDDTLFIGIIRDPVDWLNSIYREQHHFPEYMWDYDPETFLKSEFWSIHDESSGKYGEEIMKDRHVYTGKRYENIFELRKIKLEYLLSEMYGKVKNYVLIRYEDLRDSYDETLKDIKDEFNLDIKDYWKENSKPEKIGYYKKNKQKEFKKEPKEIYFRADQILDKLDIDLEEIVGYC